MYGIMVRWIFTIIVFRLLEWLEWYNSIPPEKQLAVNSIPAELYTDDGVGTVDADQEK